MATNGRAWPLKLKERCEAVGWLVTMTKSGHYKVRTKRGCGFSFPSTPGDRRAELNALAEAKRHGLKQLEARLSRLAEQDRQRRLKRGTVGDALVEAMVSSETELETESKEEGEAVQKEIAQREGALGYVGDVAIVEKAPAMHETPLTRGKRVPLVDGEELLLADGTVVYRCAKPAATVMHPDAKGLCHRTFDTVNGLKGHITYHSRKSMPEAPGARKKREREAPRKIARKRVSQVARAATKRSPAKVAETALETTGIVAQAVQLVDQFDSFKDELEILGKSADELVTELRELVRLLPESVADEDTLAAAQKYEELRKHFR